MTSYILPEDLQAELQDAVVMGAGYARAIDRLGAQILDRVEGYSEESDFALAIMAAARHLATSLQEVGNRLDMAQLEEISDESPARRGCNKA